MLADIIVKSNFPDVLSCGVEYAVSFQILMDERRSSSLKFEFSNPEIVKRISKTKDEGEFLYYDDSISFVLTGVGVYSFSILLDDEAVIYKKEFILEEIIDNTFHKKIKHSPICLELPKNVNMSCEGNTYSFTCLKNNFEDFVLYHHSQKIKKNNKVYCGLRYIAPERSTHWRIKTFSDNRSSIQDSGFTEFTNSDGNMVDWYFPIAELFEKESNILENTYYQSIGFYIQCGNEYVELDYNEYTINISYPKNTKSLNTTIWNDEILKLIYFIREGYQTKDLIRKYGAWHSLSEDEISSDVRKYKDNFGEFALNKGLIETTNQAILLNYAVHYTLIDSIIKLGITDLKQTREDFQDLMLKAKKGIGEVLPQIK